MMERVYYQIKHHTEKIMNLRLLVKKFGKKKSRN